MALTDIEKDELIQEVINELSSQSTSIDEIPEASSIDETDSLPAYKKNTSNLLKVPITLLAKPAKDAADVALVAASKADSATEQIEQIKNESIQATNRANSAAEEAIEATKEVNLIIDDINDIKEKANNADTLATKLSTQLKEFNIESLTTGEYEELETKEDNTIYFCTENNE